MVNQACRHREGTGGVKLSTGLTSALVIATVFSSLVILPQHSDAVLPSNKTKGAVTSEDGGAGMLLSAFGTSECFRRCIRPLTIALAGFLQFHSSFDRLDDVCRCYTESEQCIREGDCEDAELFKGISQSMDYMCRKVYQLLQYAKPCLQLYQDAIFTRSDKVCGFKKALYELLGSNNTKELAEEDGNQIVLLEELGPLCKGVSCFVAKVQRDLNFRCPVMGFVFAETALIPIEALQRSVQGDLLELVSGHIPKRCQIFLQQTSIMQIKIFGVDPSSKSTNR